MTKKAQNQLCCLQHTGGVGVQSNPPWGPWDSAAWVVRGTGWKVPAALRGHVQRAFPLLTAGGGPGSTG